MLSPSVLFLGVDSPIYRVPACLEPVSWGWDCPSLSIDGASKASDDSLNFPILLRGAFLGRAPSPAQPCLAGPTGWGGSWCAHTPILKMERWRFPLGADLSGNRPFLAPPPHTSL